MSLPVSLAVYALGCALGGLVIALAVRRSDARYADRQKPTS